jgi:hypothetical protein
VRLGRLAAPQWPGRDGAGREQTGREKAEPGKTAGKATGNAPESS